MPTIFDSKDLPVAERAGLKMTTLANRAMLGTDALQVQRVTLAAGTQSGPYNAVNAERFVYVVRGTGQAFVNEEMFSLGPESVLWLEAGDSVNLEAGPDEFEFLLCQAPASE